jgi:hypothetical protein
MNQRLEGIRRFLQEQDLRVDLEEFERESEEYLEGCDIALIEQRNRESEQRVHARRGR